MVRETVDLSKSRSYSRNKRAGKAVKLLREHLDRKLDEYRLDQTVNHAIWERGASKPPRSIEIEFDESEEVPLVTVADETAETTPEQTQTDTSADDDEEEEEMDTEERQATSETEYEQALDGTVSEAKESIQEMDDPDYDRLLQLEKVGKDRKTLKEWLENR